MDARNLARLLGLSVLATACVMAVSASAAQAEFVYLLNGVKEAAVHLGTIGLSNSLTAENKLKFSCTGSSGLVLLFVIGGTLQGTSLSTLTGCKWVGSEKICTINDPVTGKETIHLSGKSEMTMVGEESYLKFTGTPLGTVVTEGVKCVIPEEEEITGTVRAHILEFLKTATLKLLDLETESAKLGNSKVTELTGELHLYDFLDSTETIAFHLCNLPGQPAC